MPDTVLNALGVADSRAIRAPPVIAAHVRANVESHFIDLLPLSCRPGESSGLCGTSLSMVATHAVDAGVEQLQQAEALRYDSSRLAALNPAPDVGSKISTYHLGTRVLSMDTSWENMHLVEGNARVPPHPARLHLLGSLCSSSTRVLHTHAVLIT